MALRADRRSTSRASWTCRFRGGTARPIAVWLSGERFDSLAKIGKVDAPILMLHGDRDSTVPVTLGRTLRDAAPAGVRWVEIGGGSHSRLHTDAPQVYRQSLEWLMGALQAGS